MSPARFFTFKLSPKYTRALTNLNVKTKHKMNWSKRINTPNNRNTHKIIDKTNYLSIVFSHQLKQQMIILFLSFGVPTKSQVPYFRVSFFLTSAFLTSEIMCLSCLGSTETPFLVAYFMSRPWASSRRLWATSQRGDSGIHLFRIKTKWYGFSWLTKWQLRFATWYNFLCSLSRNKRLTTRKGAVGPLVPTLLASDVSSLSWGRPVKLKWRNPQSWRCCWQTLQQSYLT